jgi:hypothetical protein
MVLVAQVFLLVLTATQSSTAVAAAWAHGRGPRLKPVEESAAVAVAGLTISLLVMVALVAKTQEATVVKVRA